MKKLLTISSLFLLSVAFTQCATKKAAADPGTTVSTSSVDAQKVADVKKQFSEAQMQEGKTIWQASCAKCHKLFEPASRTVAKWETILPNMSIRAKLNQEQAAKVRAYVISHAKLS
jgi:cytochrome c5